MLELIGSVTLVAAVGWWAAVALPEWAEEKRRVMALSLGAGSRR